MTSNISFCKNKTHYSRKPHLIPAKEKVGIDKNGGKHYYMGSVYGPGGYNGGIGVCNNWVQDDIRTLDKLYRHHIYHPKYNYLRKLKYDLTIPCMQYQIAKKGETFTQEAIDFMLWKKIKPLDNQLKIKAIYNEEKPFVLIFLNGEIKSSPVITYEEFKEQEKLEKNFISRFENGIYNARLLTTALWLGLIP